MEKEEQKVEFISPTKADFETVTRAATFRQFRQAMNEMNSGSKELRATMAGNQPAYVEGSKNFCYKHKLIFKLYNRAGEGTPLCKNCYSELREQAKKKKSKVELDVDMLENIGFEIYQNLDNVKQRVLAEKITL